MEQNCAQSQLTITLHFPSKAVFHSKSDSKIFESITYSKIVKDTVQKSAAGVSGLRIMTLTLASSPQHYLVNLNVFCCFYSVFLFSLQKDGPYWTPIYVWPISTTFQKSCVRLIKTEASWPPPSTLSASHLLKTETEPKAGTETETETGTETENSFFSTVRREKYRLRTKTQKQRNKNSSRSDSCGFLKEEMKNHM